MKPEEMNVKATFKLYTESKDSNGRNTKALDESFTRWAKVEQTSGSRTLESMAINYKHAYLITKRYDKTKPLNENYKVEFGGEVLSIASVIRKEIGFSWFEEITAYSRA